MSDHLLVERAGRTLRVTLNRPGLRNAFNDTLIADLSAAFREAAADDGVQCVVLAGAGKAFCAGADLAWMKSMASYGQADNAADAKRLAGLFELIDGCPKPVVGRIQGAAIGGGVGLVACCDVPIVRADTVFAFSEVRLGLAPAVISPFVVAKIGVGAARELFVTGARFDAERALAIGLANHVVADDEALDEAVARTVASILKGGPRAVAACKRLAMTVADLPRGEAFDQTAALIAQLRASEEGQEGMRAFLQRDRPAWTGPSVDPTTEG